MVSEASWGSGLVLKAKPSGLGLGPQASGQVYEQHGSSSCPNRRPLMWVHTLAGAAPQTSPCGPGFTWVSCTLGTDIVTGCYHPRPFVQQWNGLASVLQISLTEKRPLDNQCGEPHSPIIRNSVHCLTPCFEPSLLQKNPRENNLLVRWSIFPYLKKVVQRRSLILPIRETEH